MVKGGLSQMCETPFPPLRGSAQRSAGYTVMGTEKGRHAPPSAHLALLTTSASLSLSLGRTSANAVGGRLLVREPVLLPFGGLRLHVCLRLRRLLRSPLRPPLRPPLRRPFRGPFRRLRLANELELVAEVVLEPPLDALGSQGGFARIPHDPPHVPAHPVVSRV